MRLAVPNFEVYAKLYKEEQYSLDSCHLNYLQHHSLLGSAAPRVPAPSHRAQWHRPPVQHRRQLGIEGLLHVPIAIEKKLLSTGTTYYTYWTLATRTRGRFGRRIITCTVLVYVIIAFVRTYASWVWHAADPSHAST